MALRLVGGDQSENCCAVVGSTASNAVSTITRDPTNTSTNRTPRGFISIYPPIAHRFPLSITSTPQKELKIRPFQILWRYLIEIRRDPSRDFCYRHLPSTSLRESRPQSTIEYHFGLPEAPHYQSGSMKPASM